MSMATLTVEIPEYLAEKVQPFSRWLATILEISILPLETKTATIARDIITFLASNPSEDEVMQLEISSTAREHLKRLLTLSDAEALSPEETQELDELEKLEHIIVMLKMHLAAQDA